jgi:hypothetical protein
VLLGSFNIGRVEISGRQSLMAADGNNLSKLQTISPSPEEIPGDDRGSVCRVVAVEVRAGASSVT